MHGRTFSTGVALVGATLLAGCGGGEDEKKGKKDPVAEGRVPPADPGGPQAAGTTPTTLAVTSLLLGDTNPDGTPNPNAWKTIGFNLDGILSTPKGTNHCKPLRGSNPDFVKTDGEGGIDNSFGFNLMQQIISTVAPDASPSLNASLQSGDFTVIVHLENADDSDNQSGIRAALLGGAVYREDMGCDAPPCSCGSGAPPCFDGTDEWPLTPSTVTLSPGDTFSGIADAKVQFPSSYIANGTWVSGSKGDLDLAVTIEGVEFVLKIRNALIAMDLTGRGADAQATNGVIAGLLVTEDLIAELRKTAGSLDESLCEGPTFDSIAQQVRAQSDIMADGTNGDSRKRCDAISVGLGFTAGAIGLGKVADPVPPPDNPCPM